MPRSACGCARSRSARSMPAAAGRGGTAALVTPAERLAPPAAALGLAPLGQCRPSAGPGGTAALVTPAERLAPPTAALGLTPLGQCRPSAGPGGTAALVTPA